MTKHQIMAVMTAALLMVFGSSPLVGAQSLSPESALSLDYAAQLLETGDCFRAAGEAKRFLFFYPDDPRAADARELLEKAEKQMADQGRVKPEQDFDPWRWSLPGDPEAGEGGMVGLVRFYQDHLRTFKRPGSRCPSYPNCSTYAIEAVKKHGGFLGTFIYVDRFWREVSTAGTPPVYLLHGLPHHFDPLAANDYWLTGSVPSHDTFTTP